MRQSDQRRTSAGYPGQFSQYPFETYILASEDIALPDFSMKIGEQMAIRHVIDMALSGRAARAAAS